MNSESEEFLEELRRVLDYNPETGNFIWKVDIGQRARAGNPAGCVYRGRLCIRLKTKTYFAHRLAWLLIYGKWPDEMIDHIDGNPLNNRITNLRDVTRSINAQNQRKAQSDNKTKLLGVCLYKQSKKFRAKIQINSKTKHLGYFLTAEEASAAYLAAKREFHEGCTI